MNLHSACNLNMNESKVSYEEEWQSTLLLFIDEVSSLMDKENRKLDRNLRKMTGKRINCMVILVLFILEIFSKYHQMGKQLYIIMSVYNGPL